MWLLNTTTYELHMFGANVPPYAILSHTWGADEVTFQDIQKENLPQARTKAGFFKIQGTCIQALRHNISWAWIDSCCIDKTSSAELSEAINSMYSYYLLSRVCFVYLSDVPSPSASTPMGEMPALAQSKWFTRGWTLQELIAPRRAIFYASDWTRIGTKGLHRGEQPFIGAIAAITGVFESVLSKARHPRDYSIAERMSWAAARQTTRPEDLAYCLMGLFGVHIPVLYGEGLTHAFQRLQHEIIRTSPDETIFAWRVDPTQEEVDPHTGERRRRATQSSGLLADSPADFARSRDVHQRALHKASPFRLFSMTNMGLSIVAELIPMVQGSQRGSPPLLQTESPRSPPPLIIIPIGASDRPHDTAPRSRVGLYLEPVLHASSSVASPTMSSPLPPSSSYSQVFYRRVKCDDFCFAPLSMGGEFPAGEPTDIFVLEDEQFAEMRWADRAGGPEAGNWSPSIGGRLSLSPSASPRASPRLG
ncbi:het domain protein [Colletotrichum truncatum]|uniref:Het domain protein n=1 Tax=Colletotrichum truncatum TaxID=5467 RepID=A0ACC3YFI8_COLTU|nr:het domain protein [Colletotrichum truncatum]KAF6788347.1 het domain protein [Colletotrichum truncatum]